MKIYNKLVRDRIPEIIMEDGKTCEIEIVSGIEKQELLEIKLLEEVNEYLEDRNLEELSDVMEVLFGIANELGYSEDDLIKKRNQKLEERGGFKEGIVLKGVK
ncbi:nucleoside triphosphate pyrophosphohydrolase [Clostridium sp. 1001275B_160808_H3]|uniref:nucleoside triphosphate pyrophosphohydrolase n=1 Tax=Clostridium sp. 1001275B_160808_H3 TaxID=2787110 RepID=UPI0018975236|nr:nucleoside triphosphate pyrophosphohydrolase [Clostridium sp. 1001275B_160808_H3]